MRHLVHRFGADGDRVCAAYAQAERDGEVLRRRNGSALSADAYALALWKDGVRKGWLGVR